MTDNEAESQAEPQSKRGGFLREVGELLLVVVMAGVLAWFMLNYVVRPYQIPSASMEETIMVGDRVLSEQVSYYFGEPEPGQVVTFKDVEDPNTTLIKRCIAVAGQVVDLRDGAVYVDGEKLDEPYTLGKPSYEENGFGIAYPYTVPDGCIWCMGDNRTNSSDSRTFGPVPVENVTGHAFMKYWPVSSFGLLE